METISGPAVPHTDNRFPRPAGENCIIHSQRNAFAGSTRAALRAGNHAAAAATAIISTPAATKLTGSAGSTPYNRLFTNRVSASAAATPTAKPIPAITRLSLTTIHCT